ncbi:MAG: hypothetical protein RIG77_20745 [Cyclobacteriaceae bacterium]
MAGINFFTNPDHLPFQSAELGYGPVFGEADTKYRVSSLFTGSLSGSNPDPRAYAAASGHVFISMMERICNAFPLSSTTFDWTCLSTNFLDKYKVS